MLEPLRSRSSGARVTVARSGSVASMLPRTVNAPDGNRLVDGSSGRVPRRFSTSPTSKPFRHASAYAQVQGSRSSVLRGSDTGTRCTTIEGLRVLAALVVQQARAQ